MKYKAFIKDHPLNTGHNASLDRGIIQAFPLLNEEETSVLKQHFDQKTVSAKGILCDEGEKADFAAIVLDGKICAMKKLDLGDKKIIFGVFGKGSIVNGTALASNPMSSMSFVAAETTKVLILSKQNFEKITLSDPWLGMKILRFLLDDTHSKLNNAYERIVGIF